MKGICRDVCRNSTFVRPPDSEDGFCADALCSCMQPQHVIIRHRAVPEVLMSRDAFPQASPTRPYCPDVWYESPSGYGCVAFSERRC